MTIASNVAVQRQIVLPLSKAVEIAYKSIRLRLSRSLLVTSGIVLALAFLMSILVTDAMCIMYGDRPTTGFEKQYDPVYKVHFVDVVDAYTKFKHHKHPDYRFVRSFEGSGGGQPR